MRKNKPSYTLTKDEKSTLVYKNIQFRSPLEIVTYKILEQSGLKFKYEPKSFELQEKINYPKEIWGRTSTGSWKEIRSNIIQPITHTPDFIIEEDYILEVKGFPTPDFLLKRKMLWYHLFKSNQPKHYFMIHKIKEAQLAIERIKQLMLINPKLL